jgi:hypothetical protein
MVKVCGEEELLNDSTVGTEIPPPDGVIVMAPANAAFGVTVKAVEAEFSAPPMGPFTVKLVAGESGLTTTDPPEGALVPAALVAVTVQM